VFLKYKLMSMLFQYVIKYYNQLLVELDIKFVVCWCSQRMADELEQQRLTSVAANERVRRMIQSENEAETIIANNANMVAAEKLRRAAASARRKVVLEASRLSDPVGLNMLRAPSGPDLNNFEHDPEQSILMMHALFGNDFLLTPPPRNMSEAEAQEYKDALYEQCAVSDEARNKCISDYKEEMSSERYV
jgi:hypothetical protein